MNRFAIIMAAVVIGFIGVVLAVRQDAVPEGEPSNHIVGEGTSGVTLIEYGDFQCPACGQYYPIIQAVKEAYGDEISFQFRHFPLIGSFQNTMAAHRAAEAAGKQGMFMEMHDLIYERQTAWSEDNNVRSVFEGYANELELDIEQFNEDFDSAEVLATINADRRVAEEKEVTSTPTFFINDERIENPASIEEFFEVIDRYIEQETGEPSQNSPLQQGDGEVNEDMDLSEVAPTEEEPEQE